MIEAIGVIIPAHQEEALLPACLEACQVALRRVRALASTKLVVALDACRDASATIAGEHGLAVEHRCVGRARAAGVDAVLASFGAVPRDRLWLAMTDADSRVPPDWLEHQIALANGGAAAVAGTVLVDDWGDFPARHVTSYEEFYATHEHVHGTNLGVCADAYLAAGGFAPIATGEDVALWNALVATGAPLARTRAIPVVTSSRLAARAPDGFASFLRSWAA